MSWVRVAIAWLLDPAKRKAFYGLLAGVGVFLVALGVADDSLVAGVTGVVVSVLDAAALILASVKARKAAWSVLYVSLAAVVTAVKVAGWITDGQESWVLHIVSQALAIVPLLAAFLRTDPTTPTGEPVAEYEARHAGPQRIIHGGGV